jgi:plastin-1
VHRVKFVKTLCRNGLSANTVAPVQDTPDDVEASREERAFRLWINSLGIATYVNNLFEDVKTGLVQFPTAV